MKQHKLFKSKKGEDMLVDFYAILVFVVILIIFFFIFYLNKGASTDKVNTDFQNKDVSFMLNSFLRAPTIYEGKSVAEIIVEDQYNADFSRTQELLNTFFANVEKYNSGKICRFEFSIPGNKFSKKVSEDCIYPEESYTYSQIPIDGESSQIQLDIIYVPQK